MTDGSPRTGLSSSHPASPPLRFRGTRIVLVFLALALAAGALGVREWAHGREQADLFAPAGPLVDDPGKRGWEWERLELAASKGERVEAWVLPGPGPWTVLWLHGNGVNMGDVLDRVRPLVTRFGATVVLLDYRGYGNSSRPEPSEKGMYDDAESALDWITLRRGVDPGRLVVYGHSLGAGVAMEMALRHRPAALVLESPFTSVPDMARLSYPCLPVEWLTASRFDNLSKARRLSTRLLVIHGEADPRIPFEMGRKLYAAAPAPKAMLAVPGAVHSDCWRVGGEAYWEAWGKVLTPSGT